LNMRMGHVGCWIPKPSHWVTTVLGARFAKPRAREPALKASGDALRWAASLLR
jgi:hypothetical protein